MLDYVGLGADLGEEEPLIRDTAREFVDERIRPDIDEIVGSTRAIGRSPAVGFHRSGPTEIRRFKST